MKSSLIALTNLTFTNAAHKLIFVGLTLVTNKFNVLFYSTAELKIYHPSYSISTQDTFGITDPRSMQDAYHAHMNLVSGVARQRIPSSSSVDGGRTGKIGTGLDSNPHGDVRLRFFFVPRS